MAGTAITTNALWTWDITNPNEPMPTMFYKGSITKSGVAPQDLRNFVGVPLVRYGRPPVPMTDREIMEILRSAEDYVEQCTGLLLTPTQVASAPTRNQQQSLAASINGRAANGGMQLGQDYDLGDAPYDFKFERARDDGWLIQSLRYKPLRILDGSTTAIQQIAYIYPLLNDYFQIPVTWFVEDLDFALVRIVPSVNVTMLPLFALQLSVQGFSQSVPGGMWYQYSAGLTPYDYQVRFRFVKELILSQAAIIALMSVQGTVNNGLDSSAILADGVQQTYKYRADGSYRDLIKAFTTRRDELQERTLLAVGGPVIEVL
jgi:hypothetical protein